MINRRVKPDGLPFRVYERIGVRVYSIGYKMLDGRWAFRLDCPANNPIEVAKTRKLAVETAMNMGSQVIVGSFSGLVAAWFAWQEALPIKSKERRADSTLKGNKPEAANLVKAFGHLELEELTKTMGYEYLEACQATRPEKGNKEMALARLFMEYGIKKGLVSINPFSDLTKNKTVKQRRLVTAAEMELATRVGRKFGGARHIVAMGLRTAWLCVRRSVEVRAIQKENIQEDGILWQDGKNHDKPAILIEWSPGLRETIAEALAIQRNKTASGLYIFGNMQGSRYTKGGWKSMLTDLMRECILEAKKESIPFKQFSLQECRPMGVSDKLERGDTDVKNVTGHASDKMIQQVYDRRLVKRAKPAG